MCVWKHKVEGMEVSDSKVFGSGSKDANSHFQFMMVEMLCGKS